MLQLLLCTVRVCTMHACPCVFLITYRGGGSDERSQSANARMIDLSLASNLIHLVRTSPHMTICDPTRAIDILRMSHVQPYLCKRTPETPVGAGRPTSPETPVGAGEGLQKHLMVLQTNCSLTPCALGTRPSGSHSYSAATERQHLHRSAQC